MAKPTAAEVDAYWDRIAKPSVLETEDTRAPPFSDEALALRFAERHECDLRYVAAWTKWLRWDGARWRFDDTLHAFDLVRQICREARRWRGSR